MKGHIPREVALVMRIRNLVIVPIMIVVGFCTNLACWYIVSRRELKNRPINSHLKAIVMTDLYTAVSYLPLMFNHEGCLQNSVELAVYKAYVRSSLIYYSKFLTLHFLLSLTWERFLGVYSQKWFLWVKRYTTWRLVGIWSWVTICTMPSLFLGSIESEGEEWRATSVFRTDNTGYKTFVMIALIGIPALALIVLSIATTVGIVKKSAISAQRRRYIKNTIVVLIVNAIYITLVAVYGIIMLANKNEQDQCYSDIGKEVALVVTETLTMLWSILNVIIFLVICTEYKLAAKRVLYKFGLSSKPKIRRARLNT